MQPKILTTDLFGVHLADVVIDDYLRQPADLGVDLTDPDVDPKLANRRKQLRMFVAEMEMETLQHYTEPITHTSRVPEPGRFSAFYPDPSGIYLAGYREVTQQDIDDDTAPALPDGSVYEVGDPHITDMDAQLLFALRRTIAAVCEHETQRPSRHIEVKTEGQSREEYVLTERPSSLYRLLEPFDAREPFSFL
jgi:hypothetical protein